ncbi:MAG: septum formation initiator family protein [Clostridium sp.]|nr:septum formation initiator family protein [Clostridium sp.]
MPFLITIGAIATLYFFNDNSALTYYDYEVRISNLRAQIRENQDTLEYYQALNRSLDTDREALERIVRERYHMQRTDEEVYLIGD